MSTQTSFHMPQVLPCLVILLFSFCIVSGEDWVTVCVNKTSIPGPCDKAFSEIHAALEYAKNISSFVTVSIYQGTYDLSLNTTLTFVRNFSIVGEHDNITIECHQDAGISFMSSSAVTIENLQIKGCGAAHEIDVNQTTVVASLFFSGCSSVALKHVQVLNGTGMGTVLLNTNGTNLIISSHFKDNPSPSSNSSSVYGGGLQIVHLPFRLDESSGQWVAVENVSCSMYNITNCSFVDNGVHSQQKNVEFSNTSYCHDGCGGGVLIVFVGNDSFSNKVHISDCRFVGNSAHYGGAIYVSFSNNSASNGVEVLHTWFIDNSATSAGGGARLRYHTMDEDSTGNNNFCTFQACHFEQNSALVGGGVSISTAKQTEQGPISNDSLSFIECSWLSNSALVGSAIQGNLRHPLNYGAVLEPVLDNCSFIQNNASQYEQQGNISGMSTVSLESIPLKIVKSVHFLENHGTPIFAINSMISFFSGCNSTFENNTARQGGALLLVASAFINVQANTTLNFIRNRASDHGGALYAYSVSPTDFISEISSDNCAIRYNHPSEFHPDGWETEFNFLDNTGKSGRPDSIYMTSLLPCIYKQDNENRTYAMQKVFCWGKQWNYNGDSCANQVRSAPAHLTIDSTLSAIAGNSTPLNAVAYDDQEEDVTRDLILTVNSYSSENIYTPESYSIITDNHIQVLQNTNDENETTLYLSSTFPRIIQAKVKVKMLPCPVAYKLGDNGSCVCDEGYKNYIQCDPEHWKASIMRNRWIGKYKYKNDSYDAAGYCTFCQTDSAYTVGDYIEIPSNGNQYSCPHNREGSFCSQCKDKFGVSCTASDYRCVHCPDSSLNKWILHFLLQFIPSTVMIVTLFVTNFSLASGPLIAAIFFAQMITTTMDLTQEGRVPIQNITEGAKVLLDIYNVVYGIWSLDFFKPWLAKSCLSQKLRMSDIIALRYFGAFFPLLFICGILALRYFDNMNSTLSEKLKNCIYRFRPLKLCADRFSTRRSLTKGSSLQNLVASCIILIYTRCVIVTAELLAFSRVINSSGEVVAYAARYDPFYVYYEGRHKIYMILGLIVIIGVLLPIPLVLLFFRYDKNKVSNSYFNIFLESFQRDFRCSSDEGCDANVISQSRREDSLVASTISNHQPSFWRRHSCCDYRDYRWMAGVYFVFRVVMVLTVAVTTPINLLCQQLICIIVALNIIITQPYKESWNNKLDSSILLLMVAINAITTGQLCLMATKNPLSVVAFSIQYALVYIPIVWISWYVVKTIFKACRWNNRKRVNNCPVVQQNQVTVDAMRDEEHSSGQAGQLGRKCVQFSRDESTVPANNPELVPFLESDGTESDSSNE